MKKTLKPLAILNARHFAVYLIAVAMIFSLSGSGLADEEAFDPYFWSPEPVINIDDGFNIWFVGDESDTALTGDDIWITGDDIWITGDNIWITGDDVWITGDDVWITGDDIWITGDDIWITGDDIWITGDDIWVAVDGIWLTGDDIWITGDNIWINDPGTLALAGDEIALQDYLDFSGVGGY